VFNRVHRDKKEVVGVFVFRAPLQSWTAMIKIYAAWCIQRTIVFLGEPNRNTYDGRILQITQVKFLQLNKKLLSEAT
jgi:hypothetical protein